jgi:hypothetical protein
VANEYTEDRAEQAPSESQSNDQRVHRDRHRDRRRHHRNSNAPREDRVSGADDSSADGNGSEQSGEAAAPNERSRDRSGVRSGDRNDRQRRGNRRGRGNRDGRGGGKPSISVVIPLLNEEESLDELTNRLVPVLETESNGRYEILYIDDGSSDSSFEIIRKWNRTFA